MKQGRTPKSNIRAREVVLRVLVYGVPVTIIVLGIVLGWWERIGRAAS